MEAILKAIESVNGVLNDFVWTKTGVWLLVAAGILLTLCTKVFQITQIGHTGLLYQGGNRQGTDHPSAGLCH